MSVLGRIKYDKNTDSYQCDNKINLDKYANTPKPRKVLSRLFHPPASVTEEIRSQSWGLIYLGQEKVQELYLQGINTGYGAYHQLEMIAKRCKGSDTWDLFRKVSFRSYREDMEWTLDLVQESLSWEDAQKAIGDFDTDCAHLKQKEEDNNLKRKRQQIIQEAAQRNANVIEQPDEIKKKYATFVR